MAVPDWNKALTILADAAATRRVGLIIDEFPYLVAANRALPSLIQRWWDTTGSKANVVVILAGSQQSMMRSLVSSEGALYGRPTRSQHLRPFDYYHAGQFAKTWPAEDRVRLYAVAGGIPDYLEEFDTNRPLHDELHRVAYSPTGRLFREAPDLLRDRPRVFLYSRSGFDRNVAAEADVTPVTLRDLYAADHAFERTAAARPPSAPRSGGARP